VGGESSGNGDHLLESFFNWSKSSGVRYSVRICRFAKKRPCIFCCAAMQSGTVKKRTWKGVP